LKLDGVPGGSPVFIDSNIFVYYFTAASPSCHAFLRRCAAGVVHGVTSLPVLLEVAHRLMIIEAQQKGLARGSNPAEKLARSPDVVRKLRAYEEWTLAIPRMGIEVEEVTFQDLVASMTMRQKMGLLTLDAMLVAVMARLRISCLASADQAFSRIGEVTLFSPGDVTV